MLTYISLIRWTEEGVKNVKDTVKRAEKSMDLAEQFGGRITHLFWTQGKYDLITVAEFPSEDSAQAFLLTVASAGNIHTETLRAFSVQDMQRILEKLA